MKLPGPVAPVEGLGASSLPTPRPRLPGFCSGPRAEMQRACGRIQKFLGRRIREGRHETGSCRAPLGRQAETRPEPRGKTQDKRGRLKAAQLGFGAAAPPPTRDPGAGLPWRSTPRRPPRTSAGKQAGRPGETQGRRAAPASPRRPWPSEEAGGTRKEGSGPEEAAAEGGGAECCWIWAGEPPLVPPPPVVWQPLRSPQEAPRGNEREPPLK